MNMIQEEKEEGKKQKRQRKKKKESIRDQQQQEQEREQNQPQKQRLNEIESLIPTILDAAMAENPCLREIHPENMQPELNSSQDTSSFHISSAQPVIYDWLDQDFSLYPSLTQTTQCSYVAPPIIAENGDMVSQYYSHFILK